MINSLKKILKFFFYALNTKRRFVVVPFKFNSRMYILDRVNTSMFSIEVRNKIDLSTVEEIFTFEEYNLNLIDKHSDIRRRYKDSIAKGSIPVIIDCGANIGASSIYFSKNFPEMRIYAIEPHFENYKYLEKNCKQYQNVIPLNFAIDSKLGIGVISDITADVNAFRVERKGNDESGQVNFTTIDEIKNYEKRTDLIAVKVDIEGFEKELFSSNTNWIDETSVIMIELHDWLFPGKQSSKNFLKAISDRNRDLICFQDILYSIKHKK